MKKPFLTAVFFLFFITLFPQAPEGISHQMVVRNSQGQLITNSVIGVNISIIEGSSEGEMVFQENHFPTSNSNGLITFIIGQGNIISGVFDEIHWANGTYFIKTCLDPEGGTTYSICGTTQILSVPYALHSKTSEDAFRGDMKNERILNLGSPIHQQDAATKDYVDHHVYALLERIAALEEALNPEEPGAVSDIDGNIYPTVFIDQNHWMTQNLRVTKYNNGDLINRGLNNDEWAAATEGAMSIFPHEDIEGIDSEEQMLQIYGAYYNWHTIDDPRGLCPAGWSVPSNDQWDRMLQYIIDYYEDLSFENAGNSLKSCRQAGSPLGGDCTTDIHPRWNEHEIHFGNDLFGFSGIPSAGRGPGGGFGGIGNFGAWWTSDQNDPIYAWMWILYHNNGQLAWFSNMKTFGFSVRCVK